MPSRWDSVSGDIGEGIAMVGEKRLSMDEARIVTEKRAKRVAEIARDLNKLHGVNIVLPAKFDWKVIRGFLQIAHQLRAYREALKSAGVRE